MIKEETIYNEDNSFSGLSHNSPNSLHQTKHHRRSRSNNSSILSRTLTSSSSDGLSRSPSPDHMPLDSSDDIDIEKDDDDQTEPTINKHWPNTDSPRTKPIKSTYSSRIMKHSTPLVRSVNSQFQEDYQKFANYPNMPQMDYISPKMYQMKQEATLQHRGGQLMGNEFHQNQKPVSSCAVCGDRASGKHYGVLSCDGCRGFFKRSIRGNMDYVCKESNKCVIDVSRRNQCQACRLKKCLEMKMNKDAVQHQRPPRSHQTRRDSTCTPSTQSIESLSKHHIYSSPSNAYENPQKPYSKTPILQQNNSFYGQRFSPYGGLLTPKHHQQPKPSTPSELPLNHEQITAASLALQTGFNPFNSEAFYNTLQNSYLSPGLTPNQRPFMPQFTNPMAAKIALQNSLNQYPLASSLLAANSAFKNAFANSRTTVPSFLNSPVSANISSASSGYSTSDETYSVEHTKETNTQNTSNESIKTESSSTEDSDKPERSQLKSNLSLAHIMNWIKSTPSTENLNEVTSKVLYSALKWTKTQKNFVSLPSSDQAILVNESLSELFVLQMAENKVSLSDAVFMNENEENEEKKNMIKNFQAILQKFAHYKVDLMEFYLLKSIVLFKSDCNEIQDKSKIETIQEECFNTLFNYNKLNYPSSSRFGRLLQLYTEVTSYTSKLIEDSFLRNILGKNDIVYILQEIN